MCAGEAGVRFFRFCAGSGHVRLFMPHWCVMPGLRRGHAVSRLWNSGTVASLDTLWRTLLSHVKFIGGVNRRTIELSFSSRGKGRGPRLVVHNFSCKSQVFRFHLSDLTGLQGVPLRKPENLLVRSSGSDKSGRSLMWS